MRVFTIGLIIAASAAPALSETPPSKPADTCAAPEAAKPGGQAEAMAVTETGAKRAVSNPGVKRSDNATDTAKIAISESGVKACAATAIINTSRSNIKN